MKITYVLEYFPPHIGGVETLFDNLTRGVARYHDVDVFTMAVPGAPAIERTGRRTVRRVHARSRHAFITKFPAAAKLVRNADIIHTTTFVAAGTAWWANLLVKKPLVLTFHESWGRRFFEVQPPHKAVVNYVLESLIRKLYRNSAIVTPSEYSRNTLIGHGIPGRNIRVISHGIDHGIFNTSVQPLARFDFPTYLFFGRAGISKGLEYLLDAVPFVVKAVPNAKLLLMVSRDRDYRRVAGKIRALVSAGMAIELEPRTSAQEVASAIRSADVVCVPSISEGFGFSAVEAQACGVPVVASDAGSLPEVVEGGVLVEPRNPKKLAQGIVRLLKDESLRKRLGERGARHVKRYTWEACVREHLKLYKEVVKG
ncbi:MAG: glycosyltransferase family 4 protein [Candidatus Aenigmatarchaeota archaeon]|nr:MAG: glycosyltransferase family 4 protein [Candidatus Aenigmarchaeota archaeon]